MLFRSETVAKFRFDDATPLYEVDYVNNTLYYVDDKDLRIYALEQS